jgi:hypothetical protein
MLPPTWEAPASDAALSLWGRCSGSSKLSWARPLIAHHTVLSNAREGSCSAASLAEVTPKRGSWRAKMSINDRDGRANGRALVSVALKAVRRGCGQKRDEEYGCGRRFMLRNAEVWGSPESQHLFRPHRPLVQVFELCQPVQRLCWHRGVRATRAAAHQLRFSTRPPRKKLNFSLKL